ncbi:MAG: anhydro-N-acetylmuramic acid kinase [Pseudomonadota bacterium]
MSGDTVHEAELYVGLMSGTSLDGVDAVLAEFSPGRIRPRLLKTHYLPYDEALRARLLALHTPSNDEIHLSACVANELAHLYAHAVEALIPAHAPGSIRAIGCHGQTVRHRPNSGYTLQIGNAALLAELTGITVVADFRSRDIAAGGQGAPLVPAFHAMVLRTPARHRVIANIGGIANITDLPIHDEVRGWDTGPGNMLMDAWIQRHRNTGFDRDGEWAASGRVSQDLLHQLQAHPYLAAPPPKSAGREQFHSAWLDDVLGALPVRPEPADVQATLLEFTARSLAESVLRECTRAQELYVCGGGAHNTALMNRIRALLPGITVETTALLDIDPDWMEALAFAWLAHQTMQRKPGNLPSVTGAHGPRILGAVHQA